MAEYGHLQEIQVQVRSTALTTAASVSDTELVVDSAGDFDDQGGYLSLNGATLEYVGITWGVAEDDSDTIELADPLTSAADVDDLVLPVIGGQVAEDWWAVVDHGGGDVMVGPLNTLERAAWAEGVYDPPVPVSFSEDLARLEDAPGRPATAGARVAFWNTDTLTVVEPGDAQMILTHAPISGSLHVRWNGLSLSPEEWELVDNNLTILDADSHMLAGDEITTAYGYDPASATQPSPIDPPTDGALLDFEASGWKWLQIARTDGTDYSAAAFDDSSWATAAAAFGDGGDMAQPGLPAHTTEWDTSTRMWARRTLTGLTVGQDITGTIRADEDSAIFLDGVQVWSGSPNGYEMAVTIDAADVTSTSMVLAVRTTDRATSLGCYFDLELGQ